jgi:U3 small nucleolar ribonucleoprotein protein IMP4
LSRSGTTTGARERTDYSSVARHHVFVKVPPKQVQLAEVGPRFDMKRMLPQLTRGMKFLTSNPAYEIRQGTIEQKEAEREWVLAHYARTAKKRSLLSTGVSVQPTETEGNDVERPTKKRKQ